MKKRVKSKAEKPRAKAIKVIKHRPKSATVTFVGDGKADPENPEYGGKSFPKGVAVDVSAEWLKANPNIRKNSHFKVVE